MNIRSAWLRSEALSNQTKSNQTNKQKARKQINVFSYAEPRFKKKASKQKNPKNSVKIKREM